MSDIARKVQEIVDKRSVRLKKIDVCEKHLAQVVEGMDRLDAAICQMVDQNGNVIPASPYAALLASNPGMAGMVANVRTAACRNAVAKAREKLGHYRLRSARDGVYISVVGLARSGKSAVLQAFSGLNNNFIPSASGSDCTGATSIIHNVEGQRAKVILTFKSREEMVALAQEYLDKMIDDPMKRIRLRPGVIEDIRALKASLLDNNRIASLMEAGSAYGVLRDKLEDLVNHYDEWAPYAGKTEPLVLYDEREIVTFVAQKDDDNREYHKYLVVNTCRIECEFPQAGVGRVMLIDTIGLGDNALGISDSMLKTVRDESDAVIMLIKPTDGAGGGVNSHIVNTLYNPIYEACKDRNLDDWLFYLINHVSKTVTRPNSVIPANTQLCSSARSKILTSGWLGHEPCIVDVMNREETSAFLSMMLDSLMDKLDSVDEIFRKEAEEALREAWHAYNTLAEQLARIAKENVVANTQVNQLILDLIDKQWSLQERTLRALGADWKGKRGKPCPGLFKASVTVLNRMTYGKYIPKVEEIEAALHGPQIVEVTRYYMNNIRTRVKDDFLGVNDVLDRYIDEMKDDVAGKLCGKLNLGRVYPLQEKQETRKWLEEFAQEKLQEYPKLRLAADTLNDFTFSVKGFLTFEVREALETLDPDLYPMDGVQMTKGGMPDYKRIAINIYDELDRRLVMAGKQLRVSIVELCKKPSRGISAEVEDFMDRMLYADGAKREWEKFYTGEASVLWAEEIARHQKNSVVSAEWNELMRSIRQNLSKNRFTLND